MINISQSRSQSNVLPGNLPKLQGRLHSPDDVDDHVMGMIDDDHYHDDHGNDDDMNHHVPGDYGDNDV